MILIPKAIEIPPENPFLNCKLKRKGYAIALKDIIENSDGGFTIAIDGRWGTGKTTFVRMLEAYLHQHEYKTIYLNVWENDFCDDAMTCILSEIRAIKVKNNDVLTDDHIETSLNSLISAALGYLSTKIGEAATEKLKANVTSGITEYSLELSHYDAQKKGIQVFREELVKYIKQITPGKSLVFIVDELDRCRPDYAVEILEKIKHFFSVPGIIFVLSIDKQQLQAAVKGYYGSDDIDAEEYLRRFIDVDYSLPKPDYESYCNYLYDSFGLSLYEPRGSDAKNILMKIISNDDLTLRQCDKLLSHIRLSYAMHGTPVNDPVIIVCLSYLKLFHNNFYQELSQYSLSLDELSQRTIKIFSACVNKETTSRSSASFKFLVAKILYYYSRNSQLLKGNLIKQNGNSIELNVNVSPFPSDSILEFIGKLEADFNCSDLKLEDFFPYVDFYKYN